MSVFPVSLLKGLISWGVGDGGVTNGNVTPLLHTLYLDVTHVIVRATNRGLQPSHRKSDLGESAAEGHIHLCVMGANSG